MVCFGSNAMIGGTFYGLCLPQIIIYIYTHTHI